MSLEFKSVSEAKELGANFQLFEWLKHNKIEEDFIEKEMTRIRSKPNRIAIPVVSGFYITLFVDDKASKDRKSIYKKPND